MGGEAYFAGLAARAGEPSTSAPSRVRESLPPHVCGSDHRTWQRINHLLQVGSCGLVVCDALEADHPIIYVDTHYQKLTGYHATEVLGKNCRFMQFRGPYATGCHRDVDTNAIAAMRAAIEKGEECQVQLLNFMRGGQPIWNKLHILPIFGDPRLPSLVTHFAGLLDVTEIHASLGPMQTQPHDPSPWGPSVCGNRQQARQELRMTSHLGHSPFSPRADVGNPGLGLLSLNPEILLRVMTLLDPWSVGRLAAVNTSFAELCKNNALWRMVTTKHFGHIAADTLDSAGLRLGWATVARQIITLKAMNWRHFKVEGVVHPRSSFSACAVGNAFVMFGGDGLDGEPLNDTYILTLDKEKPCWQIIDAECKPTARWGHTLRWLRDSLIVLFGGCDGQETFNDLHILDIAAPSKIWRELSPPTPPRPRSWHAACRLDGGHMIVFGGKDRIGNLLNDTMLLDMVDIALPTWTEVDTTWRPPGVLGHSICTLSDSKVFMFGGLQSSGSVRVRTNDVFVLDLATGKPSWQYLSGSTLPGGSSINGQVPTPRIEAVTGQLLGGQVIMFGGSTAAGSTKCSEIFTVNPEADSPEWQKMHVHGEAPSSAWGFSACTIGKSKMVLPCGSTDSGELMLNDFRELSLVSQEQEPSVPVPQHRGRLATLPQSLESSTRHEKGQAAQVAQARNYGGQPAAVPTSPWPAVSSDLTTQAEDSGSAPASEYQHRSREAMLLRSAMNAHASSSGDETVSSPAVLAEGSDNCMTRQANTPDNADGSKPAGASDHPKSPLQAEVGSSHSAGRGESGCNGGSMGGMSTSSNGIPEKQLSSQGGGRPSGSGCSRDSFPLSGEPEENSNCSHKKAL